MKDSFKEEDQAKVVEFLNVIAAKAQFQMNTQELIKYFHLLSHMQKVILPKIQNHVLEVKRVIEPEKKAKTK